MRTVRSWWLLALCATLGACSSEGGVVGSGISSISGNVADVEVDASAGDGGTAAAVRLPFALTVSLVEDPGVVSTTDQAGRFELVGEFSGPVTLRFAEAATDRALATLGLDVPAGSAIVLEDIRIRLSEPPLRRVLARVVRQAAFLGVVWLVDCDADEAGVLLVNDRPAGMQSHQFMVALLERTVLVNGAGRPVACAGIRAGDRVEVTGYVRVAVANPDRVIVAERVVVTPRGR